MELQITFHSEDEQQDINTAHQLKKELEFFVPEAKVQQREKTLQQDDAAVSIMDVAVKILFGKDFLEKVTDVIKTWIEKRADRINARKSKIQLEIKDENGKTFSLVLENIKDLQPTIESLKTFTSQ